MSKETKSSLIPIVPETIISNSFDELTKRFDKFEDKTTNSIKNVKSEVSHFTDWLNNFECGVGRKFIKIDNQFEDNKMEILELKCEIKSLRKLISDLIAIFGIILVLIILGSLIYFLAR